MDAGAPGVAERRLQAAAKVAEFAHAPSLAEGAGLLADAGRERYGLQPVNAY